MDQQGIHVEFTITGISRDLFTSILGWMGEGFEPFFPIMTGAWGLLETASFTLAMIGAGFAALLIRRMLGDRSTDGILAPDIRAGVKDLRDRSEQAPAPAVEISGKQSAVALAPAIAASRSVSFISRIGLYYVALSLAVCWLFGTGDLGVLAAFSVGS